MHFLGSLFSSFSTFSQQCPVNSFFLAFCSIESTNLASFSSKTDLVCCCSAASGIGHQLFSSILFLLLVFIHSPTLQCTIQTLKELPLGRAALLRDLGENKTSSVAKFSFAMTSYGKAAKGRYIKYQMNPAGFYHCSHCHIFLSYLIEANVKRQEEDK